MTSYQRLRAITSSRVETSLRMVLCALVDHMSDTQDVCWPSVERIAQGAGLCERQARELLNEAEERGIIRRWFGEHKSRDITIDWSALASASAPASSRGGSRKAAKTAGSPAKTAGDPAKTAPVETGKDCHPNRQSLPPQPAKTATPTGKDCPRSLPMKSTNEANQEAPQGGVVTRPPVPVTFDPFAEPLPPPDPRFVQPTPAPRPLVAPVAPSPRVYGASASRLPAGVPADLPALLSAGPGVRGGEVEGLRSVGRISVIECLLRAGLEDTETLLSVDPERLPFQGVKDAVTLRLRAHLRARWGLDLGHLATVEREPEPPPVIMPGAPQYPHESGYLYAVRRENERRQGIRRLDYFPEASNG